MEKSRSTARERCWAGSSVESWSRDRATGSIMAATVCSPMKEASTPEKTEIPNAILYVFDPVTRMMSRASRLSSFCLTRATASMSEPMMNRTESFISDLATREESRSSRNIWPRMISRATAGRGMGSVMNRTVAPTVMTSTRQPSGVTPSGTGPSIMAAWMIRVMKNHRFSRR